MKAPKSLLFLCLGNICRSMLARGIAQNVVENKGLDLRVDGAGISAFHQGESAHPPIIQLAQQHGLDISHFRSKPITQALANRFEWIVAMDKSNIESLKDLGITHPHVCKLGDFGLGGADIPDPYTFTRVQDLERVYAMVEQGVGELLATYGT
ncbi:low molecular weight protein-tyrosine-phosphatase [Helicobacter sp. L8]|uniref:low molecular weight protein-tyrosine-phosphatase n=1 Tax=Helicobacter sp. L8 TaxID=2316078 RepID=UPI000EB551C3|nr:low molecular weight protein-tyrosine-phosphatase [Helicobacter sp. L8]